MGTKEIIAALHPLERAVLPHVKGSSRFSEIVAATGLRDVEVMRAIQWLSAKQLITIHEDVQEAITLGENGIQYLEKGLPEIRLLQHITGIATPLLHIQQAAHLSAEEAQAALGLLRKKGAIALSRGKEGITLSITAAGSQMLQRGTLESAFLAKHFPLDPATLHDEERYAYHELKKRKGILMVKPATIRTVTLTPLGEEVLRAGIKGEKSIESLTPELIRSRAWQQKTFRAYDVRSPVPAITGGRRHFVRQAADSIRRIWLEMGFQEMSGTMVQTAFWDLDALFVPQDHPARQMQDTFFLGDGKQVLAGTLPSFAPAVQAMHEHGGATGSTGWQIPWDRHTAAEVLLRTHTTVLSARTLTKLKSFPAKFFSVSRVFRNETLDWKHLFELNQVEGIVVDPDANFRHLLGYITAFFTKLGFSQVRVRPAHFPYTEPSAEVEVFHPTKKSWVELGGAGIFRPEVVVPLLGKDIPVLAWGIGLERSIMDHLSLTDIRDLYKNDLKQLREIRQWMPPMDIH
ncbi:phenylalanine--tRNA ligase subunit alpha [Candidatus Woesearchaeota archaeon]|nr:phenylalanine--tRNA ligase subunit alpha [Candidatus Woesearchaeota archaeon]